MSERTSGSSPEADAYRAWLSRHTAETNALPSQEARQAAKGVLRVVREQRQADAPVESSLESEAHAARLREVLERGEVTRTMIDRLAVYLDSDAPTILHRLESSPNLYGLVLDSHRRRHEKHAEQLARLRESLPGGDEQYVQEYEVRLVLADILAEHDLVERVAAGLGPPEKEPGTSRIAKSSARDKNFPFEFQSDGIFLPKKRRIDAYPSNAFRTDYWTLVRLVAVALPKESGFENAQEADRIITAKAESIGREIGKEIRLIDGAYHIGKPTEIDKRLAERDKADAERVVAELRKVGEMGRAREREFLTTMRGMLQRVQEINRELAKNPPAVAPKKGFFGGLFGGGTSKEEAAAFARAETHRSQLLGERGRLVQELGERNREVWPGGNNRPKYEFRYTGPATATALEFWNARAEEEADRILNEEIARPDLERLKRARG